MTKSPDKRVAAGQAVCCRTNSDRGHTFNYNSGSRLFAPVVRRNQARGYGDKSIRKDREFSAASLSQFTEEALLWQRLSAHAASLPDLTVSSVEFHFLRVDASASFDRPPTFFNWDSSNQMRSIAAFCLLLTCSVSFAAHNQAHSSARIIQSGLPILFEPAPGQPVGDTAMVGRVSGT
jgi:hypothetical protein